MQRGGPGITEPLHLGPNLSGVDQVVPPLQESEKLIRVARNKSESFAARSLFAVKQLAFLSKYVKNDVADCVPSLFPDGSRRPPIPPDLTFPLTSFVDTIIASSDTDSMSFVLDYFKKFGLTREGNPPPERKIGVTPLKKSMDPVSHTKIHKWKITAADVSMARMQCLYDVYKFGRNRHNLSVGDCDLHIGFMQLYHDVLQPRVPDLKLVDLMVAVELVRDGKFRLYEWDLTMDVPGTLDPFLFEQLARRSGFDIVQNTKCGKNCVKFVQTTLSHRSKVYNKVIETMQQATVRNHGVDCKVNKLLNPSTVGLKEKLYNPAYHQNGLTRIEITFLLSVDLPTWDGMHEILYQHERLLADALVTCSIHDHIDLMCSFAQASIVFYFPYVFDRKRAAWLGEHPLGRKRLSSDLSAYPDGYVIRYVNRDTYRMNGVTVSGIYNTRSPDTSGWYRTMLNAAACSMSGAPPVMYICVGGCEKWFGEEGPDCMFFRRVQLSRTPIFPRQSLETVFLSPVALPPGCSFDGLGVDVERLKQRPCVLTSQQLQPNELQIDIGIDADGSQSLPELSELLSDGTDAVSKWGSYRNVSQEYMPEEFRPIKALAIRRVGRNAVERCCINYESDVFLVPPGKHCALASYVNDPDHVIYVRWGPNGFEFEARPTSRATGRDVTEARPTGRAAEGEIWSGRPSTSDKIPVLDHAQPIKGIGFKPAKGSKMSSFVQLGSERYWLPASITEQIVLRLKNDLGVTVTSNNTVQYNYLDGYSLLRNEACKVRVSGKSNEETLIYILDADGRHCITQKLTRSANSAKKRKRDEDE